MVVDVVMQPMGHMVVEVGHMGHIVAKVDYKVIELDRMVVENNHMAVASDRMVVKLSHMAITLVRIVSLHNQELWDKLKVVVSTKHCFESTLEHLYNLVGFHQCCYNYYYNHCH